MKIKIIVLSLIVTVLIACKKDSGSDSITIVAKWAHTEADQTPYTNGKYGTKSITKLTDANDYVQFNSDGTGVISASSSSKTSIHYSINGSLLTVTANNITEVDTIKQMTSNTLWLRTQSSTVTTDPYYKYLYDDYYSK